jgi:hypothetical protein
VREIQDMRKEADLHIADRIELAIRGAEELLSKHAEHIKAETLCVSIVENVASPRLERTIKTEGGSVVVSLRQIS